MAGPGGAVQYHPGACKEKKEANEEREGQCSVCMHVSVAAVARCALSAPTALVGRPPGCCLGNPKNSVPYSDPAPANGSAVRCGSAACARHTTPACRLAQCGWPAGWQPSAAFVRIPLPILGALPFLLITISPQGGCGHGVRCARACQVLPCLSSLAGWPAPSVPSTPLLAGGMLLRSRPKIDIASRARWLSLVLFPGLFPQAGGRAAPMPPPCLAAATCT